jgi:hypothetical protein
MARPGKDAPEIRGQEQDHDWTSFYQVLCDQGPRLLTGIGPGLRAYVAEEARSSDAFWSPELESLLATGASDGDLRQGVILAVQQWKCNVVQHLEEMAFEIDTDSIALEMDPQVIRELVRAARPGS